MKKLLLLTLVALSMSLCSCDEEDNPILGLDGTGIVSDNSETDGEHVITKLWQVKMRRVLLVPFSTYVMQVDNENYYYMIRLRFNQDLKVGDRITFSVSSSCPQEITAINGYDLDVDGEDASQNSDDGGWGYLVATDPIEATIKSIFSMNIVYGVSFITADFWFIETTDGNLIFVKKSKVNVPLAPGDRIVYSKYTLYDEVVAIKKL